MIADALDHLLAIGLAGLLAGVLAGAVYLIVLTMMEIEYRAAAPQDDRPPACD